MQSATFSPLLNTIIYNNSVGQYTTALAVFAGTLLVLHFIKSVGLQRIHALASKTSTDWDDIVTGILNKIGWPLYVVVGLYASTQYLTLNSFTHSIINAITTIIVAFYAVQAIQTLVEVSIQKHLKRQSGKAKLDKTITGFIRNLVRFAIWVAAVLVVLQNIGFNVTVFLGGLGVAGIAIAFALQNVLTDFFAFFSIYFDKPFEQGDFIVIGNDKGTVEHIGIKSTRIQTLQGEELIVSNQELTSTRVNNYKAMEKRRAQFAFGVTYETPNSKLKKIPTMVRKIIKEEKLAEIDRVHFLEFGDSALMFEVVYFMLEKDYKKFCDTQQRINFTLKDMFEKEGIEFAYPTQTLYINNPLQK